jgi:hypothetical protein
MIEGGKRNKFPGEFISFPTLYHFFLIEGGKRNKCSWAFISFPTLYHYSVLSEMRVYEPKKPHRDVTCTTLPKHTTQSLAVLSFELRH